MFVKQEYPKELTDGYEVLIMQIGHLIEGETDLIANLANSCALLNQFLKDINWVGFYLNKNNELVLGPFQGLPACIRIPFTKGVCGACASGKKTVVVSDVHKFPGHIACDSASNSEIVIPLITHDGNFIGVLDIDSPVFSRFSQCDKAYLEKFVDILMNNYENND